MTGCCQRRIVRLSACALCLIAADRPAVAQTTAPDRPSEGVFAGTRGRQSGESLDINATLIQAYDDNLLAETGGFNPNAVMLGGYYTLLDAGTSYSRKGERMEFRATGTSSMRYYGDLENSLQNVSYSAAAGLATHFKRQTRLFVNQSLAYSPSYLFGLFPGVAEEQPGTTTPIAPDYAVVDRDSMSYSTNTKVEHGLTRRGTASLSADYYYTDYDQSAESRPDISSYEMQVRYSQLVGRRTSMAGGYRYRSGEFGFTESGTATEQSLTIGLEHERVLSATRRAAVGFNVGLSSIDAITQAAADPTQGQFYGVLADVSFSYQFGRSWQARAAYQRGLEFVPDVSEPIVPSGVTAAVEGLLSRRLDLAVGGAYSNGESALQQSSRFSTYTANIRLRYALTSQLAVYTQYVYYHYDFGGIELAPGQPSRLERNAVRLGLTLWIPAVGRGNRAAR